MKLQIVTAAAAANLLSYADAISITRDLFRAFDDKRSFTFPSIRGHGSDPNTRFGVKAGYDGTRALPGLKVGSYWPDNRLRGLPNHGSTTLLLDDTTGFPTALVEATFLNALRTAASDAVAVDALARPQADRLAMIGTGNQAYHEMRATALVRPPSEILIVGRNASHAELLATKLEADGLPARTVTMDEALASADIIVTATGSRAALFEASSVRPGTHISAMGADGPGKQELPPALAERAILFADDPDQSLAIGEFQSLKGSRFAESIEAIGALLSGRTHGRLSPDDITIYDSSGIGLQDIAIAALALERAQAAGLVMEIDF